MPHAPFLTAVISARTATAISERADLIALSTEKRDLMPHLVERWTYLDGIAALPEPSCR